MSEQAAYIPGVCNINHQEIAYRRKWRNIGVVTTVILATVLFVISSNRWLRLTVFLPAFIAAIGHLQTQNKFCVSYAASGLQNATDGSKVAETVAVEAHKKDQAKARRMNTQAAIAALVITVLAVVI